MTLSSGRKTGLLRCLSRDPKTFAPFPSCDTSHKLIWMKRQTQTGLGYIWSQDCPRWPGTCVLVLIRILHCCMVTLYKEASFSCWPVRSLKDTDHLSPFIGSGLQRGPVRNSGNDCLCIQICLVEQLYGNNRGWCGL